MKIINAILPFSRIPSFGKPYAIANIPRRYDVTPRIIWQNLMILAFAGGNLARTIPPIAVTNMTTHATKPEMKHQELEIIKQQ